MSDLRPALASPLLARLAVLRARVAALVDGRSAVDPTAGDPLRGLYVSAEAARRIAAEPIGHGAHEAHEVNEAHQTHEAHEAHESPFPLPDLGRDDRLGALARTFGLSPLDAHILLVALAPDVDRGFEALYGYLNDDVGRRRATTALALDLAGTGPHDPAARDRFHPGAPLRSAGLLAVEDEDRPVPGRALRVPERVVAHLLGDDTRLDAQLMGVGVELLPPAPAGAEPDAATTPLGARIAAAGPVTVHLRERVPGAATDAVVAALRGAGRPVLRYRPECVDAAVARAVLREAQLRGAAVVVEPLPQRPGPLVRALASSG
ncbi:ATP-binding protein, partial [Streptomyces sp. NPDC057674]